MLARGLSLSKKPTMTVVAAALADAEGRILLQQRPPGGPMAGLWEFPGGKVEEGEVPEHALARELEEELGIAVHVEALEAACFASAPLGDRHLILLLYLCSDWAGDPQPLHATALRWTRPSEMRSLPMPPADLPLIDLLERLIVQRPD